MRVLFSNNDLIGSKWIRKLSSEDGNIDKIPSHVSFLFFDTFVIESAFPRGVRINSISNFLKHNELVGIFIHRPEKDELALMVSTYDTYCGKKYDWKSVLFQGWRIFLHKYFNRKMTLENKWDAAARYSCQELMGKFFPDCNLEMMTPKEFMSIIRKSDKFRECKL